MGESGPGCGEWYPEAVCETCGEPTFSTRSCGRRSCPECFALWAKEAAVRAAVRIQGRRYTLPPGFWRQVAHAIVAPPEGVIRNAREFWEWRSKAAEIAKEKGFSGFAVIGHPWRVTDAGKERYRREDPDYGIWVWLRNDLEESEMRELIHWSPHFHVIGETTPDMEPAKEDDEAVYHFRRSLESFEGIRDRESHNDVYGLFRYLLSHTGYPEGSTKQVTTWYGDLANSVYVEDATEEWQHEKPSEGVRSALSREIEAVAGVSLDDDENDESGACEAESEETEECPRDGCEGALIDVFDVRQYLRYNDVPREVSDRMIAAREWRFGDRAPPPGLKHPQTEEQAREAFRELLS